MDGEFALEDGQRVRPRKDAPDRAHEQPEPLGIANCTAAARHFDVPPGTYDVRVLLGGAAASSTAVSGETRRSLLPETPVAAGEHVARGFTVNVRTPEGEPTGPQGTPGPDPAIGGPAPRARRDPGHPQLPQYLRMGLAIANYADSGESTVTKLGNPQLWATVQPLIRPGDLVLIQLAHNDKTTDGATYRGNLETLVTGVREKGGRPVLVTPVVRRWFNADGTLDDDTALLVNSLGVDHPAVIRSVAAEYGVPLIDLTARTKALVESLGVEGSKAIYLSNEKRDNTHTSLHGATVYAGLVRDALVAQHLVPKGLVRVG
ncbi:GDSL-type esterase/lipase family protein [Streptomyces spinosirectus]